MRIRSTLAVARKSFPSTLAGTNMICSRRTVTRRKLAATGTAVLLTLATVLLTPGSANAVQEWEYDNATLADANDVHCDVPYPSLPTAWGSFTACFQKDGDVLWINDWTYTHYMGVGYIQWVNELKDTNGSWVPYRHGECTLGIYWGTRHGYCNKNFWENSNINTVYNRKGSRIGLKACSTEKGCSGIMYVTNDG